MVSAREGAPVDLFVSAAPAWRCLSLDCEYGHHCAAAFGASCSFLVGVALTHAIMVLYFNLFHKCVLIIKTSGMVVCSSKEKNLQTS